MTPERNKKIFLFCFVLSLCLHLSALVFWQRYSLWFAPVVTIKDAGGWIGSIEKKEKDEILKIAFETLVKEPSPCEIARAEEMPSIKTPLALPEQPLHTPFFQTPSWPVQELASSSFTLPTFSLPSEPINLSEHLPKNLIVPFPSKSAAPLFSPVKALPVIALVSHPGVCEAPKAELPYQEIKPLAMMNFPKMGKAPNMIALPDLPKLPTLEELNTTSCSDSFDIELVFLPKENEDGYLFALTLIPRENLQLPRIRQNVIFLIDRSNSVQQGRLSAVKAAVHKALEELEPEDTFNIIAFDNKMEKMSPVALPCTLKSFATAESFLEKIQLGSFFASADLYRPLFLTVPGQVENDETYTAILLTDGESLVKKNMQASLISDWTHYNQGKVALYPVCMDEQHAQVLETAAVCNKGKLTMAPTTRGIKRKLLKLMKTIQMPVAKNISCKAISHVPLTKVELIGKASQLPNLYLDQPYAIIGEADTLDDFTLFVQGRLRGRWINIKKTISFLSAKKGNKSLKQEWAMQKVFHLYERYLIEQDAKYLTDAKELLEPLDLRMAFE